MRRPADSPVAAIRDDFELRLSRWCPGFRGNPEGG